METQYDSLIEKEFPGLGRFRPSSVTAEQQWSELSTKMNEMDVVDSGRIDLVLKSKERMGKRKFEELLDWTAANSMWDVVEKLLDSGYTLSSRMVNEVVKRKDRELLRNLMKRGVYPSNDDAFMLYTDIDSLTLLLDGVRPRPSTASSVVSELLKLSVDKATLFTDLLSGHESTMLPWAAVEANSVELLEHLHRKGVPMTKDNIATAIIYGRFEALDFLLNRGVAVDQEMLDDAISNGDVKIVKRLLELDYILPTTSDIMGKMVDPEISSLLYDKLMETTMSNCLSSPPSLKQNVLEPLKEVYDKTGRLPSIESTERVKESAPELYDWISQRR